MTQLIAIPTGEAAPASLIALTDGDPHTGANHATAMGSVASAVGALRDQNDASFQVGPNANSTINVEDGTYVGIGAQTGGTHTYTIAAPTGARRVIVFFTIDALGQIVAIDGGVGGVGSFPASGQGSMTLAYFDKGGGPSWYVVDWAGDVTISASP